MNKNESIDVRFQRERDRVRSGNSRRGKKTIHDYH